ncbi:MAG: hypothetical protein ACD_2C00104G0003 [uncultured bacterium (gcode 4)]|uniref:Uncharacterized protein n=1 Tax=uncultured bacterium (gcode 4) TaxID=1234023 RepID=K2H1N9_9BACT|nr:MAG: hypothetical protein ACD_2C00104G0003 [uncultured bacterium (gcode 4)]
MTFIKLFDLNIIYVSSIIPYSVFFVKNRRIVIFLLRNILYWQIKFICDYPILSINLTVHKLIGIRWKSTVN